MNNTLSTNGQKPQALALHNDEREKHAERVLELEYQNEEKDKRIEDLMLAYVELLLQNPEREKRAADLIIANVELQVLNEENEMRAAELVIAYKELLLQNIENEKRATALFVANKEIVACARQLEQANKELESYSYYVSHELHAPLCVINTYINVLEQESRTHLNDETKTLFGKVQKNTNKMGLLIDQLLAFAQLGKKAVKRKLVNMNDLIASVLADMQQAIPGHTTITCGQLTHVMADQLLIEQVIANLISNAVKYSSKQQKPTIHISSLQGNGEVIFTVQDNGVGFDMQFAGKLFGTFQRLHNAEEFPGSGVGLAMVQRIIQKHDGRVWASSTPGEGTAFSFTLPLIQDNNMQVA